MGSLTEKAKTRVLLFITVRSLTRACVGVDVSNHAANVVRLISDHRGPEDSVDVSDPGIGCPAMDHCDEETLTHDPGTVAPGSSSWRPHDQ